MFSSSYTRNIYILNGIVIQIEELNNIPQCFDDLLLDEREAYVFCACDTLKKGILFCSIESTMQIKAFFWLLIHPSFMHVYKKRSQLLLLHSMMHESNNTHINHCNS